MPEGLLKSLASRYGVDQSTVESAWNECRSAIKPDDKGGPGYGDVVSCVKAKLRKSKGGSDNKTSTPAP